MLFPIIAIIVAATLLVGGFLFIKQVMADRPPAGAEPVPPTVLQRTAIWGCVTGLVIIGAAAWMLIANGPETVYDDDTMRLQFTGIVLTGLALFAMFFIGIHVMLTRRAKLDERDLAVLSRAPIVQGALMMVTLAAWTIGLQETFRGQPGVPVTYLHLMFWSCIAANMIAWPIGILLGYRKA
jgi:hypothetical protein